MRPTDERPPACQIDGIHGGTVAYSAIWCCWLCPLHLGMIADNRALVANCAQLPLLPSDGVQLALDGLGVAA